MPPPVTAGLEGHFDATEITGLSDNDPVSQWDDVSGEGHDAVAPSSGARPLYKTGVLNGLPVVRFDGSNDELETSGWTMTQPHSYAVVARSLNTSGQRVIASGINVGLNGGLLYQDSGTIRMFSGTVANSGVAIGTDWRVLGAGFSGASSVLRIDGSQTNVNPGTRQANTLAIGSNNLGASYWQGDIAELLVYSRLLTTQEFEDLEDYLNSKWLSTAQNIDVGSASEAETANPITPDKPISVDLGTVSEAETANPITASKPIFIDIGTASEAELAQLITPSTSRQVAVGQATETETANPITPINARFVNIGQATETELARGMTIIQPRLVEIGQAAEVELGRQIVPSVFFPGFLAGIDCQIATPSAVCSTSAPTIACSISS